MGPIFAPLDRILWPLSPKRLSKAPRTRQSAPKVTKYRFHLRTIFIGQGVPNVFLSDGLRKWKPEREGRVRIASRHQAQNRGGGSSPGNSHLSSLCL